MVQLRFAQKISCKINIRIRQFKRATLRCVRSWMEPQVTSDPGQVQTRGGVGGAREVPLPCLFSCTQNP